MTTPNSVEVLESLIKFIDNNNQRDKSDLPTLCRDADKVTVRGKLPCSKKDSAGDYIIKCDFCPFSSVEAGEQTIKELEVLVKKEKLKNLLLGNKVEK
jgi:hypothetical protein